MRQHITRRVGILLATVALALTVPLAVFAGHQFTDVPNSNIYHADIDALVDSGVTTGCGGTRYCPSNFVTREQMAAFMNRLGALAPGKTPVVNAAELNGVSSTGYIQYGANVPGNTQLTGVFTVAGTAAGAGAFVYSDISFVRPLNGSPTVHVILPAAPVPAGCSGSVSSPSANAGHMCLFVKSTANASALATYNPVTDVAGASSRGALLRATASGAGTFGYLGTWAARSPLTISAAEEADGGAGGSGAFAP
jgi:hypothetical protein